MFKPNSQKLKNDEFNIEETIYKYLYKIPPKEGRYIILDTETTGLDLKIDRLISINAIEIVNGELTGIQFNAYLHKRFADNSRPLMYYLSDYNYSRVDNIKKSLETFLSFVPNKYSLKISSQPSDIPLNSIIISNSSLNIS